MLAIERGKGVFFRLYELVSRIDGNEERLLVKGDDLVSGSNMDAGRSVVMGGDGEYTYFLGLSSKRGYTNSQIRNLLAKNLARCNEILP